MREPSAMQTRSGSAAELDEIGPLYRRVKDYVLQRIQSNEWTARTRIPSEQELTELVGVSRMTVNRAMRELAGDGFLKRVPGVGTFVADPRLKSHPLEIQDIAADVAGRGRRHTARSLRQREIIACELISRPFEISSGLTLFQAIIVHMSDGEPVQYEERYVLPSVIPDFLMIDLSEVTVQDFLTTRIPLVEVEQTVRVTMPEPAVQKALEMGEGEPCLLITRRIWTSNQRVASVAYLYHPGDRFELGGRFPS